MGKKRGLEKEREKIEEREREREREREKWSHWGAAENHPMQETQAHHTSKLWAQVRSSPS